MSPRRFLFLLTHNRVAVAIRRPFRRGRRCWRKSAARRQAGRAVALWHRIPFVWREFRGDPGERHPYRLRRSHYRAWLRHQTDDTLVATEIAFRGDYEFPDAVRKAFGLDAPRVVSLGGHIGLFGLDCFRRWPEAHVTEIEADPGNADMFLANVELNHLEDRWALIQAFAATEPGFRKVLRGHGSAKARAVGGPEIEEAEEIDIPAVDVLPILVGADLIKMDIEGGEWEILADPRFKETKARAIVLEHHPQLCPDPSPRELATRLLERAGFRVIPQRMKPNEVGLLWGVRDNGA